MCGVRLVACGSGFSCRASELCRVVVILVCGISGSRDKRCRRLV